jgi:glucoamylase
LVHTRFEAHRDWKDKLRLFVLLSPHLDVGGEGNYGNIATNDRGMVLTANKNNTWLALAASVPYLHCSCGYVGATDGWQDLNDNLRMDWAFDCAPDGNIALTGELDIRSQDEFVLALAFGDTLHQALFIVEQSLAIPFAAQRTRFIEQWKKPCRHLLPGVEKAAGDKGRLFHVSNSIVLAHEDKTYDGAVIASLSIPWGEFKYDKEVGGYHLIWTRDMCQSATGLLAAGNKEMPLRALIYLACAQRDDGGFYQNFWIDGEPYWQGTQLDQAAFPILLAWHLAQAQAMQNFDPFPMVLKAAGFLIDKGPVTPQERWEENSGFSPSTLAAHIAGLICAASFAKAAGKAETAQYLEEYADFLESHLDGWTVTTQGSLVPGITRHFIRIHPADPNDPRPNENANDGMLTLRNQRPGSNTTFPAKDIVDGGFLELVRYGVRKAHDPVIEDTVRVIDAVLKVQTPAGATWRRYNHDGYGQRQDGGPYEGWGYGHAWPLLTGERGHYELAAGGDAREDLRIMERLATSTGLLPEQVWALADIPDAHMKLGHPTGGAMPLVWAHSEYMKLVRSIVEGRVVDTISIVADRYRQPRKTPAPEIWKFNRQVASIPAGRTLRIQAAQSFRLCWTNDEWKNKTEFDSSPVGTGHYFVDIAVPVGQKPPVRFTFDWKSKPGPAGDAFQVDVEQPGRSGTP